MITPGKYHELTILRSTSVGLYLGDEEDNDILLPTKYCPEDFEIGDTVRVFVYRDSEDRLIATNLTPAIALHEFAFLKVKEVGGMGAFLDWGLEKDLLVPFAEQKVKMQEGKSYVVYLELDAETDRLFASSKIEKFLENDFLRVEEGEEVDLIPFHHSELGYSVIVNKMHLGLLYDSDVFRRLSLGDELKGFVKKIRPDNKLDITLQPLGYEKFNEVNTQLLYDTLRAHDGFLELTDNSSPAQIYAVLGISKKAYKKAVGALYKDRKIALEENGLRLVEGGKTGAE